MTPETPITDRDEINTANRGVVYKHLDAVCEMLTVTKRNGRCRLWFDCRTNRPLKREAAEISRSETHRKTQYSVST